MDCDLIKEDKYFQNKGSLKVPFSYLYTHDIPLPNMNINIKSSSANKIWDN